MFIPWTVVAQDASRLVGELGCAACHPGLPFDDRMAERSGPLADIRARMTPRELFEYLQSPEARRSDIGASRMPDYRFRPEESLALTLFLTGSDKELEKLSATHTNVTAETGRRIYRNQNCGGCHMDESLPKPGRAIAPGLGFEGTIARPEWLKRFLAQPEAIRPHGYLPGTGTRMPDFGLSAEEVATVSGWLMNQTHPDLKETTPVATLSAFSANKAKMLIRERYACLGCHQLDGQGGRIGPELDGVWERRSAAYVNGIIKNPQHFLPDRTMPKIPMPDKDIELITAYLMREGDKPVQKGDTPLVGLTAEALTRPDDGKGLYLSHCAACHGATGKGDGFNAPFLDPRPSVHADVRMSAIADDTLYDGIHAGGYILNKSAAMPPWGATFGHDEIRSLVAYIRTLCECKGPEWSR